MISSFNPTLHQDLIKIEQEAELAETQTLLGSHSAKQLEENGLCIRKLTVAHVRTGVYSLHR